MGDIKVGTCGYQRYDPPGEWKKKYKNKLQAYSDEFETCELNRTFYKLPMTRTAERWRRDVMDGFDFTMKAWQALTHPTSSPTWRKRRDDLTVEQSESYGHLSPNEEVFYAWERTRDVAESLDASVCVLQTPKRFDCCEENRENMKELLSEVDRDGMHLAWEPRGDWLEHPSEVKKVCKRCDLVHIVDLMRRDPVATGDVAYVRLHGLNEDEYNYDYVYPNDELDELAQKLERLARTHDTVYCMFNNTAMSDNAMKLQRILAG